MDTPVLQFMNLFQALAGDAAEAWYGNRDALGKLFKGSSYSQRRNDWFPADGVPRRAMQPHDYKVLRHLIASAVDKRRNQVVGERSLRVLDDAYRQYVSALATMDARRNRGVIGRTHHVSAAKRRFSRFLDQQNCLPEHFLREDVFDRCFREHILSLRQNGDEVTCARLARSLCLLLNEEPQFFSGKQEEAYIAAAYAGLCGLGSSRALGDGAGKAYFHLYLNRLYHDFPDPVVIGELWATDAFERSNSKGLYKCLEISDQVALSRIYGAGSRFYGYTNAAYAAVEMDNIPVNCNVKELGWRSPQNLCDTTLDGWVENRRGYSQDIIDAGVSSIYDLHAAFVLHNKDLDGGREWIERSRAILPSSSKAQPFGDLSLKYEEIRADKLEWELTRNPLALIACIQEIEKYVARLNSKHLVGVAKHFRKLQPVS